MSFVFFHISTDPETGNIMPNIIVKGGDYTVDTVVGNELAEVVIFPTIAGASTTKIIDEIRK